MRPMRSIIPHQWRHRHLGEEVGITGTVLEAGITGTVLEAGITGARLQRPKVLTLRSPMRPMRGIPSQSWRVGRIPHQWRHRHLGEEAGITGTVLVAGITGARLKRPKVLTLRSPMRPMRGRIPHQWRHRHLGEEVGITGTVLEAGITGTVLEAGITGTVLERRKVLTLRSPMRPMRGTIPHHWRVGRIP